MKKLLLHTCCAPCLTGVHKALMSEDVDFTAFFFNPNIHPEEEFHKRLDALQSYINKQDPDVMVIDKYDMALFEERVVKAPGDRCENCYRLRLERTAFCAAENGYNCFSTTILISPHQKHDAVKRIGEETSKKFNIEFFYRDFRPFYDDSIRISKELGLYRQKYCGCYLSKDQKD